VEEDALAKLLIHLIGLYEDRAVIPLKTSPRQVLQHLMEQRGLKQRDMVAVFGTASIVSEILSGKREINAGTPGGWRTTSLCQPICLSNPVSAVPPSSPENTTRMLESEN
jgi:hypothetical protein